MVPLRHQVGGVSAGAAGRVEDRAGRQGLEEFMHDRLIEVEETVARLVVGGGPAAVRRRQVPAPHGDPWVVGQHRLVQQPAYLGEAGPDERLVVVAGPRPQ